MSLIVLLSIHMHYKCKNDFPYDSNRSSKKLFFAYKFSVESGQALELCNLIRQRIGMNNRLSLSKQICMLFSIARTHISKNRFIINVCKLGQIVAVLRKFFCNCKDRQKLFMVSLERVIQLLTII